MVGSSRAASSRGGLRRWEWAAVIGLPIILNVALAAYLLRPGAGGLPLVDETEPPAVITGDESDVLPEPSRSRILTAAEDRTGDDYVCDGPRELAGGISTWGCRTEETLAVIYGLDANAIFLMDVTWFGFDEAASVLPAWAAAALGSSSHAETASAWVAENVGTDAVRRFGDVTLRVSGAEGARSLVVEGD